MIYIHIPFCKSRCLYCDFFSTTSSGLKNDFVNALSMEMKRRADEIRSACANTVYIGGGTPSQLDVAQIERIFNELLQIVPLEDGAEVTIECNPDDITPDFIRGLKSTPVNRISMGLQTLNDKLLALLRRRHTSAQALLAVDMLCRSGYDNISLDLMYGLPGQTLEMWKEDVQRVLSLSVPHLSAYSLQWEEGTPLFSMLERGEVSEAPEDLSVDMYDFLLSATKAAGMDHYEISNFAIPGMYARHNSGYWRNEAYVGLGPGAHSYDGDRTRCNNPSDLKAYIAFGGAPQMDIEVLTDDELYEESVLKGLRTSRGLDLGSLLPRYSDYALKMAKPHIESGNLVMCDNTLILTEKGFFVSNDVMSDMML